MSPRLLYFLEMWRQSPQSPPSARHRPLFPPTALPSSSRHFAVLGKEHPGPVLVFLEDTSLLSERVSSQTRARWDASAPASRMKSRNPVGALSHAGQLLGESPNISPQEKRLTEIIRTNSERVSTIINNVLQLSRRTSPRPERPTLEYWIEELRGVLRDHADAGAAAFIAAARTATPDRCEVRVDPTHLHQVVWNLCDNALKHSARGEDRIEIAGAAWAAAAGPILEIADHGPGIAEDVRDKIFEPFFTGSDGGTGLGFVHRARSSANATAHCCCTSRAPAAAAFSASYCRSPALGELKEMPKATVLIIDDEPDIRELLSITLSRMDLESRSATSIKEAHKAASASERFDLCLTDMNLPDGNGLTLVEWMQQHRSRRCRWR